MKPFGLALRVLLVGFLVSTLLSVWPVAASSVNSVLHGFAAASSTDVWATGYSFSSTGPDQTLAEHWGGASWQIVSTPSPGAGNDFLNQPVALGPNDVWVVGSRDNTTMSEGAGSHTLIEHWGGSSWQVVSSPNAGDSSNVLRAAAAVSPTDIWAGGFFKNSDTARRTLIQHFNGSSWQVVPSPNTSSGENSFSGLAAVSASDLWAVGTFYQGGLPHSLAEHFDGTSWSVVSSPSPGVGSGYPQGTLLWAASAVSSTDVWAVGQYYDGTAIRTLTEHWDGTGWSVVSSPNATAGENQLRGVVALGPGNVWAVGWSNNGSTYQTLIEHFDGTNWSIVPSPDQGTSDNYLKGIAAISSSDIWTGAYYSLSGIYQTLTEHFDGASWSIVASPNVGAAATVPAAPTLSGSAGDAVVHLSWSVPADAGSPITGYNLYRGTTSGGETLLTTVGNVTSYDDTGVSNGTTYYYQVSAVNGVGEGARSNEVSVTPQASSATVPGAPVLAAASANGKGVMLSWTAPSDGGSPISGYRIYRGTAAGAESLLTSVGTVTTYKDTATRRGTVYYYKVTAVNAVGEGPFSNEGSAKAT